jgi:hypothetical protein
MAGMARQLVRDPANSEVPLLRRFTPVDLGFIFSSWERKSSARPSSIGESLPAGPLRTMSIASGALVRVVNRVRARALSLRDRLPQAKVRHVIVQATDARAGKRPRPPMYARTGPASHSLPSRSHFRTRTRHRAQRLESPCSFPSGTVSKRLLKLHR